MKKKKRKNHNRKQSYLGQYFSAIRASWQIATDVMNMKRVPPPFPPFLLSFPLKSLFRADLHLLFVLYIYVIWLAWIESASSFLFQHFASSKIKNNLTIYLPIYSKSPSIYPTICPGDDETSLKTGIPEHGIPEPNCFEKNYPRNLALSYNLYAGERERESSSEKFAMWNARIVYPARQS